MATSNGVTFLVPRSQEACMGGGEYEAHTMT
jgi:hypothetical protein